MDPRDLSTYARIRANARGSPFKANGEVYEKGRAQRGPAGAVQGDGPLQATAGGSGAEPPLKVAGSTRLELATSGVTGRRSNQLNYDPARVKPSQSEGWWAVQDLNL